MRKIKLIILLSISTIVSIYAQLDTRHYIPPFYGREDRAEGSGEDIFLLISTPQTTPFDVRITDGAGNELSFSPVTVSRAAPANIALSSAVGASKGPGTKFLINDAQLATVQTDEGLILTANKAFFTSIRVDESAQAGFLTAKGTAGFGKTFRTGHVWNVSQDGFRKSHSIGIMATEDNTSVEISDFGAVDFENVSEAGGIISVNLDAGESYVLTAFVDRTAANLNDVIGTLVTSDKFIVVNSGSWLAGSPTDGGQAGRDIGIDQIAPVDQTGFEYILIKGQGTANENVIIVSGIDGTNIFLNGGTTPINSSPLSAGDFLRLTAADYTSEENMYLSSNQPVYVYQGLNGSVSTNERQNGLNYMPPIVCLGGTNVDISDIDQLGNPVIQVIAEVGELVTITDELGTVTDVTSLAQAVTGNSNYVTYKLTGYSGDVTVESPRPIRVALTIESGNIGGAGFFSGFTLTPVIETPNGYNSVTCIPDNLPVTLTAAGFDSYQWFRDDILLVGETNADISVNAPGRYTARGTISGCVSSEKSFPLFISLCQDDLGIAKNVVSEVNTSPGIFDLTYDLIVTNYNPTNPANNLQIIQNIEQGLSIGGSVTLLTAPSIISGTLSTGGINPSFDGTTDPKILTTSNDSQDASLTASSTLTIRYTVRADVNSATSPGYFSQAIVTSTSAGPNDGVTGPFESQDFSDAGTNPDPNGNNDPTEDGENDVNIACLINYTINYASGTFYTNNSDPLPTITGLTGGEFSSTFGLTIDRFTGLIDVSNSVVGSYVVTYDFGGLCPVTTNVTIALAPFVNRLVTNDFTPVITGANGLGAGQPPGETVTVTVNGATYTVIPDGIGRWSVNTQTDTPSSGALAAFVDGDAYDVVVAITDASMNVQNDVTTDELIIDSSPPVAPTVNDLFTDDLSPVISGTNGLGASQPASETLRVTVNGATYQVTPDTNGDWQINTGSIGPQSGTLGTFTNGTSYDILAIVTDLANNSTADNTINELTIDTTAPLVPTVNPLNSNIANPIITGTWDNSDAINLEIEINGLVYRLGTDAELITDASGNWTLDLSSITLPDAVYEVEINTIDRAGNNTNDTSSNEILIDTSAPTVSIDNAPISVNSTNNFSITVQFNEDVSGFILTELALTNATASNFTIVNASTYQIDVAPDGNGDITLNITSAAAQDNASNDNAAATEVTVLFDDIAPTEPTVNPITTNDLTPIISGTNGLGGVQPVGETVSVLINGATYEVIPNASGNWEVNLQTDTPTSGTLAAFLDGVQYDIEVTISDIAGNSASDTTVDELTIDTTNPTEPIITVQTSNDETPVISGSGEANSTITVTIIGVTYTTTADGSGNWSIDTENDTPTAGGPFTPLTDGTYDVEVTSADAAGNTADDTTTNELTVDLSLPATPTIDFLVTTDQTPIITGTNGLTTALPAGESLEVSINGATYSVVPDVNGIWTINTATATPLSGSLGVLIEGVYEIVATVTDLGGNIATDLTNNELEIDLTAPSEPNIDTDITNDSSPIITGNAEPNSVITLTVNSVTFTTTTNASGNWTVDTENDTPTADGPFVDLTDDDYDISVTSTDAAGNTNTDSTIDELTIDTTNPNVPTVNSLLTNLSLPTISGSIGISSALPTGESLEVLINGAIYQPFVDINGNWEINLSADTPITGTLGSLTTGTYEVIATVLDEAGNSSDDISSDELVVDQVAPSVPTISTLTTNVQRPVLSGTGEPGSEITVLINSVSFVVTVAPAGDWTLDLATATASSNGPLVNLNEGIYDIQLTSRDAAGNSSNDITTDELTIDTSSPIVPTTNILVTNDDTPILSGTAEPGSTLLVIINGVSFELVVPSDGTWQVNTETVLPIAGGPFVALSDAIFSVDLTSTDEAGNNSNDITINELTVDTTSPNNPTVDNLDTPNPSPILTGTAEINSVVRVTIGGLIFETTADALGNWSINTDSDAPFSGGPFMDLAIGTYNVEVTSIDAAGNNSSDVTIDELTIVPVLTVPTVNSMTSNDGLPVISGSWDEANGSDLTVAVDGDTYSLVTDVELTSDGSGNWTLDLSGLSTPLADGTYEVVIVSSNATQTTTDATSDELTVSIPILGSPTTNSPTSTDGLPVITGTWDETNGTDLTVTVDGVTYTLGTDAELTSDGSGNWTLDLSGLATPLTNGLYDVEVVSSNATQTTTDATTDELTVAIPVLASPTIDNLTNSDGFPIITGTWDEANGTDLAVTVDGVTYTLGTNAELTTDGSGNWTLDLSGLATPLTNGSYDVEVVSSNATQTTTDATTDELTVAIPVLASPTIDNLTNSDGFPIITGTWDEANGTDLAVTVDGVTYTLGTNAELTTDGSGNWTLDLSGLATPLTNGSYDVEVVSSNATQTTTDATTDELTVAIPVLASPTIDNLTNSDGFPIITGTWDEANGTGLTVTLDGVTYTLGTDGELTTDGSGNWTLDLSGMSTPLANGTYDVLVSSSNGTGTATDATTDELTVAIPSLGIPTVDAVTNNDGLPALTGTWDETNATSLEVTVDGVTYVFGTDPELTTDGSGNWTLDLSGLATPLTDGTYDVVISSSDGTDTVTDSTTDELTVTIPTMDIPTVNNLTSTDGLPTLTGTWDETDATSLEVTVDGVTYVLGTDSELTTDGSGNWTLDLSGLATPLTDGTYDVVISSSDGTDTVTDSTTDELTVTIPTMDVPTVNNLTSTDGLPTLTGTWDETDATSLEVTVDGVTYVLGTDPELTTDGSGNWTLDLNGLATPLTDGTYDVVVSSSDGTDTVTDSTTDELTVTIPTMDIPTVNNLTSTDGLPTLTGTWDETNATSLEVTVDGVTYVLGTDSELTTDGSGNWTLDLSGLATPLTDGTYDVIVSSSDGTDTITDSTTDELTVTIPTMDVPTVNDLTSTDGLPTLTGTWDETNATSLEVTVDGVTYVLGTDSELTTDGSGNWTLDLSGLATPLTDGTYDVIVSSSNGTDTVTDSTTDEMTIVSAGNDSDGDGVLDIDEDVDGDGDPTNDDTDGDGTPDYLDGDDDGDGVATSEEDVDSDGDPTNDDTDGDGTPDYLDGDDDGDGVLTSEEDVDGDGDPTNDDTDGDGTPDYLDGDDDGDGVPTSEEDVDGDGDPTNDDTDGDGTPDYLDGDDDGDGVATSEEDVDGDGDPTNDDTDGDGTPDYLDGDDDGDGVPTSEEDVDGDGDPTNDDTDNDGTPDYLDPDSPGNADIGIIKSVSAGPYLVGNTISYKIIVENFGPGAASNVTVTDDLSLDLRYIASNASSGVFSNNTGEWKIDRMELGFRDSLIIEVEILDQGVINNEAEGYADENDPNLTNNLSELISINVNEVFEVSPGFSPDGDGINDIWQIRGISNYPNNTVQIYNRWGNLVYEVKGYDNRDNSWKGEVQSRLVVSGNNVPDGTYFYLIDLGDGSKPLSGYITLIR